jgi:hypothetical protein
MHSWEVSQQTNTTKKQKTKNKKQKTKTKQRAIEHNIPNED